MTGKKASEWIGLAAVAVIATIVLGTILGLWIKFFWIGLILSSGC